MIWSGHHCQRFERPRCVLFCLSSRPPINRLPAVIAMLGEIKTPTLAELFVGDLAAVGNWVVANVRSSVAWPLQVQVVDFRGHRIFVVPRSTATVVADGSTFTHYPFAAVNLPARAPFTDGRKLL